MHRNARREALKLKRRPSLTDWHRGQAEAIAQAFPLTPTTRIRASGNHLVAQSDEPEAIVTARDTRPEGMTAAMEARGS